MQRVRDLVGAVPALTGRVHGAAQLGHLHERGAMATAAPAAFVFGMGLTGGAADVATGMFRQQLERFVSVVLVARHAGDATGQKAGDQIDELKEEVILAVAGEDAGDAIGVFVVRKGELISLAAGAATYQLDFAISDQLRITR
jgi:hypothetical protein